MTPDPVSGRLQYQSFGPGAGQCFLSCHGVAHSPLQYPAAAPPGPVAPPGQDVAAPDAARRPPPMLQRTLPQQRDRFQPPRRR